MNSYFERRYTIAGIFIVIVIILLARLFYIQIIDNRYAIYASNNVRRQTIIFPARGPILDRNGKILVQNQTFYDIMVTPKQVKPFDTLEFCKLLGIDKAGFDKRWMKAVKYSPTLPSAFEKQLTGEAFASLQERLSEFPGFDYSPRYLRVYPDSIAAQFLGFIGEVSDRDIERSGGYYHLGDYIGETGVEKSYETVLRGQRGVQNWLIDSKNKRKGRFANGLFDTAAVAGQRLKSSLDINIQRLGEQLMKNKLGSIVAIEPSTGEILCYVSSPTYDPNLMVGRQRGNNAAELYKNPYKPFFIRPIQAYYPPGSSFKPLSALIALQNGIITPETTYNCPGYYWAGNTKIRCTHVHGTVNLSSAVSGSCNGYFSMVFQKIIDLNGSKKTEATFNQWRESVNKFGLGSRLGLDMPNEGKGNLPTPAYYNKVYRPGGWRSSTVVSLAIGQGELEATPLQLANIECTIANHGFYYKPHLIKSIGAEEIIKKEYTQRNFVGIDSQYFEPVINGMQAVVDHGTAIQSKIPGIIMCGKTGTAQNPHGENHSVFVAYAPRENPKIAIAVVVENSGEGARWAAPIASFIVEKYLKGSISKRESGITPAYFMNANKLPNIDNYTTKGKRRAAFLADSLKKAKQDSVFKQKRKKAVNQVKDNQQQNITPESGNKKNE
jgi:penicillin-binding protein 2